MKLVKGETLTALLQARSDPRAGQRRFLSQFLQACQAMAYAHSRGVVHRDLKPSNLMVGSYGEVMILDWGFAKVLSRGGIADEKRASLYRDDVTRIETVRSGGGAESIQGSVMGTPAYMPPEQALGNIDDLDKRSDVFSLGAVLCEILTGTPPYGTDANEVVLRAARGNVDEACERLDACGAEDGLVSVCKTCLAPLRKDRHQDAKALADAIEGHLTAMEERARRREETALRNRKRAAKAEADAAAQRSAAEAARTKAAEERARAEKARNEARYARDAVAQTRRVRKQVLAIAGALLGVILVGGGAYVVKRNLREARIREVREALEAGLDKAQRFQSEDKLSEAVVAARQALDVGQQGEGDPTTLVLAEELIASLEATQRARADHAAKRERERVLRAALEPCRSRRSEIFDATATDAMYGAALRAHGIDLANDVQAVAEVVRACLDPEPVIDALDDWAWLRRVRLSGQRRDWDRPLRVAAAADDDPWRNDVRAAVLSQRTGRVRSLAGTDPAQLPVASARLLAMALALVGDNDGAVEFLGRAQLRHAGDPLLLSLLVYHDSGSRLTRQAAVRHATALVTLRPDVAEFRIEAASVEGRAGALNLALKDCRAALALDARLPEAHRLLARLLERNGDRDDALSAWRAAVALDPESGRTQARLGLALLHRRDLVAALRMCRRAAALEPDDADVQLALAKAALANRNLSDARAACKAALRVGGDDPQVRRALGLVFLAAKQVGEARREMNEALRLAPADPFVHNCLGLVLMSEKDFAGAQAAFTKAAGAQGPPRAAAWANLGALWLARGDLKASVNACREAIAQASRLSAGPWSDGFTVGGRNPLDESIAVLRAVIRRNDNYAYAHHRLGVALAKKGQYMSAIRECQEALVLEPDYGYCLQTLAWIYASCPMKSYRNPKMALELAERLAKLESSPQTDTLQILGLARYRMRNYEGAVDALENSVQARAGGDAWDWYFLAMGRWQLGNKKTARRWLAKAQAWTDENAPRDAKLQRFRAEAEELIE
jgi:serine/threonine-protein kinase